MTTSDETLLRAWATRRDADAFAEIVSRYSAMVYAICKRILANPTDAEDVSQECFIKLAQTGTSVRRSLGGWLARATASA